MYDSTAKAEKTRRHIFAATQDSPEMTPKPRIAAIRARTRNTTARPDIERAMVSLREAVPFPSGGCGSLLIQFGGRERSERREIGTRRVGERGRSRVGEVVSEWALPYRKLKRAEPEGQER